MYSYDDDDDDDDDYDDDVTTNPNTKLVYETPLFVGQGTPSVQ